MPGGASSVIVLPQPRRARLNAFVRMVTSAMRPASIVSCSAAWPPSGATVMREGVSRTRAGVMVVGGVYKPRRMRREWLRALSAWRLEGSRASERSAS